VQLAAFFSFSLKEKKEAAATAVCFPPIKGKEREGTHVLPQSIIII